MHDPTMPADTAPPWPDRVWLHKSTSGQDDVWTDTPTGLDSPAYVREAAVTAREAAAWAAGAAAMREMAKHAVDGIDTADVYSSGERHAAEEMRGFAKFLIRALPLPPMPATTQGGNADE